MLDIRWLILLVAMTTQVWVSAVEVTTTPGTGAIQVEGCIQSDQCVCRVSSNWSVMAEYKTLQQSRAELVRLNLTLSSLSLQKLTVQMSKLTIRLNRLELNVHNQSIGFSIKETTELKRNIEILKAMLLNVTSSGQATAEQLALSRRVDLLSDTLESALSKNPYEQNSNLKKELERLRSRLSGCRNNVSWTPFISDELPVNHSYTDWCETHKVGSIAPAITHKYVGAEMGSWSKDPVLIIEANRTKIFQTAYSTGHRPFYMYNNFTDFIQNRNAMSIYSMRTHGVGYVFFNHSIYYHYVNHIYRYNVMTRKIISKPVTKANINYDKLSINSYVDFKVDEYGLWMVVATAANNEKLVVMKMNPETLEIIGEPHRTNKLKSSLCGCFIICGTLYTVEDCQNRLPTNTQEPLVYTFEIESGTGSYMSIHPRSKYGHLYSINYNPRERKIFGWDSRHLVTYDIIWKPK